MLASASPRRKELLAQIGLEPEIRPSRMEEETREKRPDRVVMELSRQKAEDVASGCPGGTMVIGAIQWFPWEMRYWESRELP